MLRQANEVWFRNETRGWELGIEEGDVAVWGDISYLVDDYFTVTQPARPTRQYVPIAADKWKPIDAEHVSSDAFEQPFEVVEASNLDELLRGAAAQLGGVQQFAVHVLPPDTDLERLTGGAHAPCISVWSNSLSASDERPVNA